MKSVFTGKEPEEPVARIVYAMMKGRIEKDRAEKTPTAKPPFHAPSVDDVRAYCIERGNNVDAESFVDFYASKGWKVGRTPMKDWKAAVRTWKKRDGKRSKADEGTDYLRQLAGGAA